MQQKTIEPIGSEQIVYQGKIHEIVQQKMKTGEKEQIFEFARRSPGTRLIIVTPEDKILLTEEYRHETDSFDFRLPGGKVFDTLTKYNAFLKSGNDIIQKAKEAAMKEAREEVGIEVKRLEHFYTSKAGATIVWNLFYFVVGEYESIESGQNLGHGEDIRVVEVSFDKARKLCLEGGIQEDRSVAVLLRFLNSQI